MNEKAASQLKKLDRSRQEMLEIAQQYSHEQLACRHGADTWSILDVINHLVMAENGTYHFMANQRDPARMPEKLGWDHAFRVLIMIITLKLPFKYKKPAKVPGPETDKNLQQLTEEWQKVSVNLSAFADALSDGMLQQPVFIHPFFGYLNIVSTLQFLREHIEHHIKQVKRIAASAGFPDLK